MRILGESFDVSEEECDIPELVDEVLLVVDAAVPHFQECLGMRKCI